MAKERLHNLKQTSSTFQTRGVVFGMKKDKAYQSGVTKSGSQWNSIEFGLNINKNAPIFIKINGFARDEVFYYKSAEKKGEKGTTARVAWRDRKNSPGEGFRLIGINISTGKDANGKNVNEMFVEYDAVEHLHATLKDGASLFIKGNMVFSSYTNKNGQTQRKVELTPTQISFTNEPIDFEADNFTAMAEFENTIVFSGVDKETDMNGKETGRFILSGHSVGYNTIESVSFIIDEAHAKLANNLRKAMKPGYSIKTFGRVSVIADVSAAESDDDGWGEASPMERINSPVRREYIVYKADKDSIDKETYTEESIAKAIKAVKNAKEASAKFVDTSEETEDWGSDDEWGGDSNDDDIPW